MVASNNDNFKTKDSAGNPKIPDKSNLLPNKIIDDSDLINHYSPIVAKTSPLAHYHSTLTQKEKKYRVIVFILVLLICIAVIATAAVKLSPSKHKHPMPKPPGPNPAPDVISNVELLTNNQVNLWNSQQLKYLQTKDDKHIWGVRSNSFFSKLNDNSSYTYLKIRNFVLANLNDKPHYYNDKTKNVFLWYVKGEVYSSQYLNLPIVIDVSQNIPKFSFENKVDDFNSDSSLSVMQGKCSSKPIKVYENYSLTNSLSLDEISQDQNYFKLYSEFKEDPTSTNSPLMTIAPGIRTDYIFSRDFVEGKILNHSNPKQIDYQNSYSFNISLTNLNFNKFDFSSEKKDPSTFNSFPINNTFGLLKQVWSYSELNNFASAYNSNKRKDADDFPLSSDTYKSVINSDTKKNNVFYLNNCANSKINWSNSHFDKNAYEIASSLAFPSIHVPLVNPDNSKLFDTKLASNYLALINSTYDEDSNVFSKFLGVMMPYVIKMHYIFVPEGGNIQANNWALALVYSYYQNDDDAKKLYDSSSDMDHTLLDSFYYKKYNIYSNYTDFNLDINQLIKNDRGKLSYADGWNSMFKYDKYDNNPKQKVVLPNMLSNLDLNLTNLIHFNLGTSTSSPLNVSFIDV